MIRKKRGKQSINSTKNIYKGIKFKSLLERFAYISFESANLNPKYEPEKWEIMKPFVYKGEKVRNMTYKVDFIFTFKKIKYCIETKGRPNDNWSLRLKWIRLFLMNHLEWEYVILKTQKEITAFINKLNKL